MGFKSILKPILFIMFILLFISISIHRTRIQRTKNEVSDILQNRFYDKNTKKQINNEVFSLIDHKEELHEIESIEGKLCDNCVSNEPEHEFTNNKQNISNISPKRQIWISMALCFSKNTHMYRKKKYPYAQVTPLAILLWNYFFQDIRIILYLIYDKYELKETRKLYEETLKQTNVEIRWVEEGDLDCVTTSQLIRMWAFKEPMIKESDIIVTVDVNLFVVSPKILEPIYKYPDKKVWVFGWHDTSYIESGVGETFNQNLMSAESKGIDTIYHLSSL